MGKLTTIILEYATINIGAYTFLPTTQLKQNRFKGTVRTDGVIYIHWGSKRDRTRGITWNYSIYRINKGLCGINLGMLYAGQLVKKIWNLDVPTLKHTFLQ